MAHHMATAGLEAPFLQFQHYGVLGAGISGQAAAELLGWLGRRVTLYDDYADPAAAAYEPLRAAGVELRFGREQALAAETEALVVSPGVALAHPLLEQALAAGLPTRGELELGWLCAPGARVAAVTGTNGKTTVTMLLARLFAEAGWDTVAAGNIGLPLARVAAERGIGSAGLAQTVFALEVSSFQLETIHDFCPEVALVLNITPDHLDRHRTMEEYAKLKGRIGCNQGPGQTLVINQDDPGCLAIAAGSQARVRRFSLERPVEDGAWLDGDLIMLKDRGARPRVLMPMSELRLIGMHNVANAMAAACVAEAMGVPRKQIAATLAGFAAAPHRLERVGTIRGVSYVNDSKGTNLGAMERAIESFASPIHLIAGGRDKASPFESVQGLLRERVRAVYLIGEAAEPMEKAWRAAATCVHCETLERALESAAARAAEGEVVLLSPGCASFDQFRSYAQRGDVFRKWVAQRLEAMQPGAETPAHD